MKKITLSAAIVALAMMGCSDAGLDNSVASTSEINSEQIQSSANEPLVLAKIGSKLSYKDRVDLNGLQPTDGNWNNNHNGYERYQYRDVGIDVEMQTRIDLDWDGYEGQGEYNIIAVPYNTYIDAPFKPNAILVVTTILADCKFDLYGNPERDAVNCNNRWKKTGYTYVDDEKTDHVLVHTEGGKLSKDKFYKEIGAVSAFIGIWGSGAELVLGKATYVGGVFEGTYGPRKARAAYKEFILPIIRDHLY